jgi:RNA polymerase sigma-70 factor (ECF subfamily)
MHQPAGRAAGLTAGRAPDREGDDVGRDDFLRDAEAFRRELIAHCYRMLGSIDDAEDLVQETYLRAWRGYEAFEGRSSVRSWLYRIATNVCLTALQHKSRRVLPSGLGAPADDPDAPAIAAPVTTAWLQPFPDAAFGGRSNDSGSNDPADILMSRSALRLALVASWQYLPARQRAVLILREVLAFSAGEVADMLEMSVPAVKSALQRARARVNEVQPDLDDMVEPDSVEAQAVLDRYIAAFENADAKALEELLRADASIEVTGSRTWFSGKAVCAPFLARHVLDQPGEYRMFPTICNGQPAAVTYRREADGRYLPFAIAVLATDGVQLTGITVFIEAHRIERFGFVATSLPAEMHSDRGQIATG